MDGPSQPQAQNIGCTLQDARTKQYLVTLWMQIEHWEARILVRLQALCCVLPHTDCRSAWKGPVGQAALKDCRLHAALHHDQPVACPFEIMHGSG